MPLHDQISPPDTVIVPSAKTRTPRDRVLSGSAVLLTGLCFTTLSNFLYNIAVARFLGPIAFGHTTAVYTLLILISSITLSFQILTAKFVAQQVSPGAQSQAYRGFHSRAWIAGISVSSLLLLSRNALTSYLNLGDSALIVLLAMGAAFYIPLGARRGYIQGVCSFQRLALNLVLEGLGRLFGSLLLIHIGLGVRGVIAANAAAVMTAYFAAQPKLQNRGDLEPEVPIAFREGLQAAVFFGGQVVINNCDIVVVKHFFSPESAGVYAAVAMVGRVVFAFSWAVVSGMFPIAAETRSRSQEDRGVLGTSLLMVGSICLVFILGLRLAPSELWTHLFGPQFGTVSGSHFRFLLVLYALSASVYGLSVVLLAYEMSRKIANIGWVQLVVSGSVITGIYLFHSSLAQVISVQVAMMAVLLFCAAVPFMIKMVTGETSEERHAVPGHVRLIRQVSESEVIAEFLKNDFHSPEFARYRDAVNGLVTSPDLQNQDDNEVRRALFNVRHAALWRELPEDTEWFEAEIRSADLFRIRVFPRAQWRKVAARGDYGITRVAERVSQHREREALARAFREKIDDLREHLRQDGATGAVLLIGRDGSGPFTVLDGNHRLVAAILTFPEAVTRFRFFCGLSPKMARCCWYQTNLVTLLHYGMNMARHFVHRPELELAELLRKSEATGAR